jgi:hypothetical protein
MTQPTFEEEKLSDAERLAWEASRRAARGQDPRAPETEHPLEAKAETQDEAGKTDWAREHTPPSMRIPAGRRVAYVRFRSSWTDAPHKGVPTMWPEKRKGEDRARMVEAPSRVLVLWTLSDAEENFALKRSRGERERVAGEYAKQFIRAVDGRVADWTGAWAKDSDLVDVGQVWRELGRCRQYVVNLYASMSRLSDEEMSDFLLNGLDVKSAVDGSPTAT